jgi:capsular exopolysaccharide synthesis family protein
VVQQLQIELADLQRKELELSARYGDRHPERVKVHDAITFTTAKLETEVTRAIDAMASEVSASSAAERQLTASLESETASASALTRRASDYDVLKRQVDSDRALYEKLRQRTREFTVSGDYDVSSVRVIDPVEEPRNPLPTTRNRNLAIGAAGSLLFALAVTFGVHFLDRRVQSPEDVETHLGLPSLGAIPTLSGASWSRRMFNEAMRDLRTHVICASAESAHTTLLVASAEVSEGKTLVATHLATGLAQIGRRVVLVDGDLRRPSVHAAFNFPVNPGLSEVLAGTVQPSETVRRTTQSNLWILPAGRPASHPGDLLGSSAFQRLLAGLANSFDTVVIDSPPVLAATDASLVAHQNTGTVFVVSADRTARSSARSALERLDAVGARFVGVVLNRVQIDPATSDYYSGPHNYSYLASGNGSGTHLEETGVGSGLQS